jgi:hypothetical protein
MLALFSLSSPPLPFPFRLLSSALSCSILTKEVEQKWNKIEGGRMARILTKKGEKEEIVHGHCAPEEI